MGLFSSSKRTTVATSVSRVIADRLLPDACKTGTIKGLLAGEQLVEYILEEITSSVGVRAERMYQYGKRNYIYGLPNSTMFYNTQGQATVKSTIETIEGRPVTIDYSQYGPLNNLHYGWLHLTQAYQYNPYNNELVSLSTLKGFPVYLTDIQVVVVDATLDELERGSLDQWGRSATAGYTPLRPLQTSQGTSLRTATPFAVDTAATQDYFRVSFAWKEGRVIKEDKLTFLMSTEDPNLDYFQVKYTYGSTIKYMTYQAGKGTHPDLDEAFTTYTEGFGSFFPFGYFLLNKESQATNPASAAYKSSKKLMAYLGMDFATIAASIDENPSSNDVETAILMMAVPAHTSNALECRYLYDFFSRVDAESGGVDKRTSTESHTIARQLLPVTIPLSSIVIQDSAFKLAIQFQSIYKHTRKGSIGAIGTYASGYASRTFISKGIRYANEWDHIGVVFTYETQVPSHYYQHQITADFYEEVVVDGLSVKYYIDGGYSTTALEGNPNLLIPLDHAITENYFSLDREEIYSRSLHYVFNSKHETTVKWYQSEFFSMFLIIVAVVITILTFGADGGSTLAATVAAVTASAQAFIVWALTAIMEFMVAKLVFKFVVKLLGPQFAMLLAVIAACYGLQAGFKDPMLGTSAVEGAPWAGELLNIASGLTAPGKLASGLMSGVNDFVSEAIQDIQQESIEFASYAKEQTKLIEDTNKLLEGNNLLSPFTVFGETPSDYYQRTVHSGNIGILGVDAIANYVEIALTLPKLQDTLGDSAVTTFT